MSGKKRKIVSAVLLSVSAVLLVSGCSKKLTPKKVMTEVTKNLAEVKSVSNTLRMEIELEGVLDTVKIAMNMEMENTASPKAGHARGRLEGVFSGTELGSEIEIYQVEEGDEAVTYSSMYDKWTRESSKSAGKAAFNSSIFEEAGDSIKSFRIAEQTIEVNEKECYQMYGNIKGKELLSFMGLDMMGAFGLVELPDEDAIMNLDIPVTIEVYKEEKLPARILVDMTDVMNNLYDKYGKSTNVNDFTIELGYAGFNQVEEIKVPQEVLEATKG